MGRPQHGGDRQPGRGDPAAVSFDADRRQRRALRRGAADTARLPTQLHLMEELKKIRRVIAAKADATAPHEVLLVIDGNTGQNALAQVAPLTTRAAHRPDRHQARRHGQGRRAGRHQEHSPSRCTSSVWAKSSKISTPLRPRICPGAESASLS